MRMFVDERGAGVRRFGRKRYVALWADTVRSEIKAGELIVTAVHRLKIDGLDMVEVERHMERSHPWP